MTKAELILALAGLPDTGEVFLQVWEDPDKEPPGRSGDLLNLRVDVYEDEGVGSPAFGVIYCVPPEYLSREEVDESHRRAKARKADETEH